jgi:hypothetical protein
VKKARCAVIKQSTPVRQQRLTLRLHCLEAELLLALWWTS